MKKYLVPLILVVCAVSSGYSQDTVYAQHDSLHTSTDTIESVNEPVAPVVIPEPSLKKEPVYKLKPFIDIPVTLALDATTLYGFSKIYNKRSLTVEEVESLNPKTINRFDRPATKHYSERATDIANYLFYGSQPLPILFLLDKRMRRDFPKLALLYLEAMGVTGVPYVSAVYFGDRYRPYTYNPEVPMDFKLRGGSRNSFFAGHPALVGTSTFFMATVYADYHPESKIKWVFYTVAAAATAGCALGRYYGGRHFPSDLLIGSTLGPLSGILIPHLHRNKDLSKRKTSFLPFFGESSGLTVVHRF